MAFSDTPPLSCDIFRVFAVNSDVATGAPTLSALVPDQKMASSANFPMGFLLFGIPALVFRGVFVSVLVVGIRYLLSLHVELATGVPFCGEVS